MLKAMKPRASALALGCALWLCATFAFGRPLPGSAQSSAPTTTQPRSLNQAVKQVRRKTHGRILAAGAVARGQNTVYRIKVLTPKGRVKVMQLHSSAPSKSKSGKHHSDQGGP
jgi:hypothetical protein